MIVQTRFKIKGREYVYTKSDEGRFVERDGMKFVDVYDPAEFGRTYTEGELIPIKPEDIEAKAEAYDILMGVSE